MAGPNLQTATTKMRFGDLFAFILVGAYLGLVLVFLRMTGRLPRLPRFEWPDNPLRLPRRVASRVLRLFKRAQRVPTIARQPDLLLAFHPMAGVPEMEKTATPTRTAVPIAQHPLATVLACPKTGQDLRYRSEELVSTDGRFHYPIVQGIPRFVTSDQYARSFSFEWNLHKKTQLDTYRQDNSSTEMLTTKTGLTPEQVRGKLVLDAGVGAGRFTDTLLRWGARVVAIDLSYAVCAAHENFGHNPNALICQADIGRLPFRPGTFDYIISIGVLHHTPDTRRYFLGLPTLLKPGGEIAIWVYSKESHYVTRTAWIPFTCRIPDRLFHAFCKVLVCWTARSPQNRLLKWWSQVFPYSKQGLGLENDILDTFDSYSPRFHGTHAPEEVEEWFLQAGLQDIRRLPWPTAVRGRRPAA